MAFAPDRRKPCKGRKHKEEERKEETEISISELNYNNRRELPKKYNILQKNCRYDGMRQSNENISLGS